VRNFANLREAIAAMPVKSDILLTTLNASYSHAAFGLRYLLANLGPLQTRAALLEFTIKQRPLEMVEAILERQPILVGIGVYIWNARESLELVANLKRLRPELLIVLGGPEVSFETEQQEIVKLADYTITGEADLAFPALCETLLAGFRPSERIIAAPLPHFGQLQLPYDLYSDEDIANRVVYVEASRGCPFTCEFCLSSLDIPVRAVPLERMLPELERLLQRGLKQFKFVDRTFNLNLQTGRRLLEFFLERWQEGLFLHFEMIPDRLPEGLREIIAKFPPGALQFEVGIQTFQELASQNISRRNNHTKTADNFAYLRQSTGVHLHADLIVGLPGEDVTSFGQGFDRLLAMRPQEIQVGILKRLRGTPIIRHDAAYGMIYSSHPPYEILQNRDISFSEMQRMRRFAKYWDLIGNSGNFRETLPQLWADGSSPFEKFRGLSDWLYVQLGAMDGVALQRLMALVFTYFTAELSHEPTKVAHTLWQDYQRGRVADRPPAWLEAHLQDSNQPQGVREVARQLPGRQARHSAGA
jgi:radical SAM superfamily enzyme YgiQ (UPF0313 family)